MGWTNIRLVIRVPVLQGAINDIPILDELVY